MLLKDQIISFFNFYINYKVSLTDYAHYNKIPIIVNGNLDKGWKGNVIEHMLNIKKNNSKAPDFKEFEIKTVPLVIKNGVIKVKETTCLCVLETNDIILNTFKDSHLYHKNKNILFVGIDVSNPDHPIIANTLFFNLEEQPELLYQIEEDYEAIANHIADNIASGNSLDFKLTGKIGNVIQPRPKTGKNKNYTWAFYLKTKVLNSLYNQSTKISYKY